MKPLFFFFCGHERRIPFCRHELKIFRRRRLLHSGHFRALSAVYPPRDLTKRKDFSFSFSSLKTEEQKSQDRESQERAEKRKTFFLCLDLSFLCSFLPRLSSTLYPPHAKARSSRDTEGKAPAFLTLKRFLDRPRERQRAERPTTRQTERERERERALLYGRVDFFFFFFVFFFPLLFFSRLLLVVRVPLFLFLVFLVYVHSLRGAFLRVFNIFVVFFVFFRSLKDLVVISIVYNTKSFERTQVSLAVECPRVVDLRNRF